MSNTDWTEYNIEIQGTWHVDANYFDEATHLKYTEQVKTLSKAYTKYQHAQLIEMFGSDPELDIETYTNYSGQLGIWYDEES